MKFYLSLIMAMICAMSVISPVFAQEEVAAADSVIVADNVIVADSATVALADSLSFIANIDEVLGDEVVENNDESLFLLPLIYDESRMVVCDSLQQATAVILGVGKEVNLADSLNVDWLERALNGSDQLQGIHNYIKTKRPDLYQSLSASKTPEPQNSTIRSDLSAATVEVADVPAVLNETVEQQEIKVKRWKTAFLSAIQLSQSYVSENWYQGGFSSLNLLSDQLFTINYNDPSGKLLFENLIQWKFNLTSSAEDTVHSVRVSEDLFQINSKFGYKAFGKWYYSASLLFKTQILTNFAANSNDVQTEFLSPGELNVGLGLSYSNSYDKSVKLSHTLTIAPLSYNLRFARSLDPIIFGIEDGSRASNKVGSSLDYTLTWDIRYNIRWMSHIYAFTNYKSVLAEWTNTLDFAFSTYFSARINVDLRFDDSVVRHPELNFLQLKELLSIGFSYKL